MKRYRIFLAIGGRATPVDNNRIWLKNLYEPLVNLGHDVFLLEIYDFAEAKGLTPTSKKGKEYLSNELPIIFNREHQKKPFDLVITYLHELQIYPDVFDEIQKKVYTINYTTNFHQFNLYENIGKKVNCNIYISKRAKDSFESLGTKSYWMPFASNPNVYIPSKNKNNNAVFIGSVYGSRAILFWRLLQFGVNIHLYGKGWNSKKIKERRGYISLIKDIVKAVIFEITNKKINRNLTSTAENVEDRIKNSYKDLNKNILSYIQQYFPDNLHNPLSDADYIKVMSEAGMVVNIAESRYNLDFINPDVLFCSNLRDFEATMSGAMLFTQYSDEIEELFEIDKEIVCYHNEHDLADKIKFYSKNIDLRNEISLAGYNRCLKNHTWEQRFNTFFEQLSFN